MNPIGERLGCSAYWNSRADDFAITDEWASFGEDELNQIVTERVPVAGVGMTYTFKGLAEMNKLALNLRLNIQRAGDITENTRIAAHDVTIVFVPIFIQSFLKITGRSYLRVSVTGRLDEVRNVFGIRVIR